VLPDELPRLVREVCGDSRQDQIRAFVASIVRAAMETGYIGMMEAEAEALAGLRSFLYRRVYLRPESVAQREAVIPVLRGLVEYFAESTAARTDGQAGEVDPVTAAVTYVSGMTDRFAMRLAVERLGWDPMRIPLTAA
jgi:dGTPase